MTKYLDNRMNFEDYPNLHQTIMGQHRQFESCRYIHNVIAIPTRNCWNPPTTGICNRYTLGRFVQGFLEMIIVRLIGGLGNQLFQYACGRNLALTNDTELKLDLSGFEKDKKRRYELDNFNIIESIATKEDLRNITWIKGLQILKDRTPFGVLTSSAQKRGLRYVAEKGPSYDSNIMKLRGDVYLNGYWQSEKYFQDIAPTIRREFSLREEPDEYNERNLSMIKGCNAVSLHIRRGDYVLEPKTMKFHGVLGDDYYSKALDIIKERVANPQVFVFSDDIQWVKENLESDLPLNFIDGNGPDRGHDDLRLMWSCKHHIIANSSFSWWGAWMSGHEDTVVIAPKRWFANEPMNSEQTIAPDHWCKI